MFLILAKEFYLVTLGHSPSIKLVLGTIIIT